MDLNKRVTQLNDCSENRKAGYVLYWMQMFKRASHNYALNFAIQMANDRSLPLVVYEGLKYYYPWANDRLHTFILEGVPEKTEKFARLGMRYIFYLQRKASDSKNTVTRRKKGERLDEMVYDYARERTREQSFIERWRRAGVTSIPCRSFASTGGKGHNENGEACTLSIRRARRAFCTRDW